MKIRQFSLNVLAFLMVVATFNLALAHGSNPHMSAPPFSDKDFEQMPWGIGAMPTKAQRTVQVTMSDNMRFDPSSLNVRPGETIRFVVTNKGVLLHEFVIGTIEANKEHAELMKRFPDMQHEAPYMAHVPPGQTEEIVWTFNRLGDFQFACLIAGHYEAGMVGSIRVADAKGAKK